MPVAALSISGSRSPSPISVALTIIKTFCFRDYNKRAYSVVCPVSI